MDAANISQHAPPYIDARCCLVSSKGVGCARAGIWLWMILPGRQVFLCPDSGPWKPFRSSLGRRSARAIPLLRPLDPLPIRPGMWLSCREPNIIWFSAAAFRTDCVKMFAIWDYGRKWMPCPRENHLAENCAHRKGWRRGWMFAFKALVC